MVEQDGRVNVFIAYAHQDKPFLVEFRKHLSPLKKRGIIKLWDDAAILPGTEWDKKIKTQLEASQIVLLLVSPDFLNSDYIHQVELPKALARQIEGQATVIPIILRSCGWEYTEELSELQALPVEGRPVSNWPNHDDAYYNILTGVKRVVDRVRAARLTKGFSFPHKDIPKDILFEIFVDEAKKLKAKQDWSAAINLFEKALLYSHEEFVPKKTEIEEEIESCKAALKYQELLPQIKKAIKAQNYQEAFTLLIQAQKYDDTSEVQQLLEDTRKHLNKAEPLQDTEKEPLKKKSTQVKKPSQDKIQQNDSDKPENREKFNAFVRAGNRFLDKQIYDEARIAFTEASNLYQKGYSKSTKWLQQKIDLCNSQLSEVSNILNQGLKRNFQGDLVGINTLSGQQIVPPIYEYIGGFRDGLALVKKGGRFGFINPLGDVAIPLQFEDGESFSEGKAKVVKGGKLGYINRAGEAVTKFEFEIADSFAGGLAAVVKNGKKMILNQDGAVITGPNIEAIFSFSEEKQLRMIVKGGKKGIIDHTGKMLSKCEFDEIFDFTEGFAVVQKNHKRGYIDRTGKAITPIGFETAVDFSGGFAAVGEKDKFGYINTEGKLITGYQYDHAEGFSEGFALVGKSNKYGYINTNGELITGLEFDSAVGFSQGLAAVGKGGKGGYINSAGKILIPLIYETAKAFSGGRGQVVRNEKHGYVNQQGNEIIPCIYEGGTGFNEGLGGVLMNGKFGYIDLEGRVVIPFSNYSEIKWFSEGYAAVKKTGFLGFGSKWGYIDRNGEEAFPIVYSSAESFKDGKAKVVYKGTELTIEKLVL